ncbi:MAG: protein kinase, partial [Thermoanaerobaculia bacterium]|nr:protein kinase [Thermoanaerobaculia bacterium]
MMTEITHDGLRQAKFQYIPPAEELPAAHLNGKLLDGGWKVGCMVDQPPTATGGSFSFSYHVTNTNTGDTAFLKALNISAVLRAENALADEMKAFGAAFVFERDILSHCGERRLGRIIRLLDHGETCVPQAGPLQRVPYLILELAEGDIRAHQSRLQAFDLAWVLRTLKHVTLGIEQLHGCNIAHQDLKPSNVLTQRSGHEMKLGDLGRAERLGVEGPTSANTIPGAISYAPPEQLYGAFDHTWELRRAGDLYHLGSLALHHLGSLALQLFVGHSATALLQNALPEEAQLNEWRDDFETVKPYLRAAHAEMILSLEAALEKMPLKPAMAEEIVRAIREMTDPDPGMRGHKWTPIFGQLAKVVSTGR